MSLDQDHVVPQCAKIADLGLTCMLPTATSTLQAENPAWLAPEIMRGEPTTTKSDVFSFGIVLYELITRRYPYDEYQFQFTVAQMDAISKDHVRPTLPSSVPTEISDLIQACWHARSSSRPSFDVIVNELQVIQQQLDSLPPLHSSSV